MKPVILLSAIDDIERGYRFYEGKQCGLGQYFENSIFADIARIERHAGIHREVYGYNRMLATRFPFAIYYRLEGNEPRIRAILDCRRDPEWIEGRLKQNPHPAQSPRR